MGRPLLGAVKFLNVGFSFDFSGVINGQIRRKQSRNKLFWNQPLVIFSYRHFLSIVESLRLAKYLYLFEQEKPAAIALWNGKKLPNQTVVEAAKLSHIDVYYFENGLLPNTTSLDPQGVNYTASIPRTAKLLDEVRQCSKCFLVPPIVPRQAHKNRKQGKKNQLPSRFIFVPFQVPHDTQISTHSPWIRDMEHLFNEVMAAVDALNDQSLYVVFKEHPSWHKHFEHLYSCHRQACFANDNNTAELIKKSHAVITINSTVGFEAMLLNKPVITLGEACFNIEGLVLNTMNNVQLVEALKNISYWRPNKEIMQNFFKYLENIYAIPGSWKEPDEKHVAAIEARLTKTDDLAKYGQIFDH